MSETKKSTMGPRRLFILLALGAVVFYYLSSGEKEKDEVKENNSEMPQDQNNQDTDLNEINETTANDLEKRIIEEPEVRDRGYPGPEEGDRYIPQSSGSSDGYTPQSSGSSDGYTPQSAQ